MKKTTECKKLGVEETAADSHDALLAEAQQRMKLAVARKELAEKKYDAFLARQELAVAERKAAEKNLAEAQKTMHLLEADLAVDEKKKEDVKAGIVSDEE